MCSLFPFLQKYPIYEKVQLDEEEKLETFPNFLSLEQEENEGEKASAVE